MNKLMGFYELLKSGLPTVPWRVFNEKSYLEDKYLWTVRIATVKGKDINLPRIIGKSAKDAYEGALELYKTYEDKGIVIYYPYFIAEKSGTLKINNEEITIEAVYKDLWNLVTYNNKEVTIIKKEDRSTIYGNEDFFSKEEINELNNYASRIKIIFKDYMLQGKTLLLEWSYAFNSNTNLEPIGDRYLVFYEVREI